MIEEVRVRDLGVIADATLPLGRGFTAVTGETGAGKTMVVTALGLLLGQRADSGVVRSGTEQASVAGVWIVPETGAVADRVSEAGGDVEPIGDGAAELYLSRSVSREGRGRATVGGRPAPAGVLSELSEHLVTVHGQSEQLRLRSSAAQREALDRFGGEPVRDALDAYRARYEHWRVLATQIEELLASREARAAEAELLREQIARIESVAPEPGEDEALAARAERLANAEALRHAAALAREALSSENDQPDVSLLLSQARRELERTSDDALVALTARLDELSFQAADIAGELSSYLADLDEQGPHELAAVEERRAALAVLVRAHGSLDEAIRLREDGSERLADLDDDADRVERLEQACDVARRELDRAAEALTAARREAAERLSEAVTEELHALALPDATLVVEVAEGAEASHGRDDVQILLAPHPGAVPRPVAKSASGGELSRVMLAIEVVIAATDPVPTFVFDEVDAGIGGAAAIEVGRRLARLAESSQVIAVTHLAQVAAFANNHLSVVKESDGSVTASSVRRLEGTEREAEMARLLSGLSDSDAALTHARELLRLGEARN